MWVILWITIASGDRPTLSWIEKLRTFDKKANFKGLNLEHLKLEVGRYANWHLSFFQNFNECFFGLQLPFYLTKIPTKDSIKEKIFYFNYGD